MKRFSSVYRRTSVVDGFHARFACKDPSDRCCFRLCKGRENSEESFQFRVSIFHAAPDNFSIRVRIRESVVIGKLLSR